MDPTEASQLPEDVQDYDGLYSQPLRKLSELCSDLIEEPCSFCDVMGPVGHYNDIYCCHCGKASLACCPHCAEEHDDGHTALICCNCADLTPDFSDNEDEHNNKCDATDCRGWHRETN